MHCPKCFSVDYIKSGSINKKQRYKCNKCQCQFTQSGKSGVPLYVKMQAITLFLCGFSMNKVAEIFDVSPPTVMRWVHYFKDKFGNDFPKDSKIVEEFNKGKFLRSFDKDGVNNKIQLIRINDKPHFVVVTNLHRSPRRSLHHSLHGQECQWLARRVRLVSDDYCHR